MASTGKRKTTMAKLQRERRLLERRIEKKAKKDARKRAAAEPPSGPLLPDRARPGPLAPERPLELAGPLPHAAQQLADVREGGPQLRVADLRRQHRILKRGQSTVRRGDGADRVVDEPLGPGRGNPGRGRLERPLASPARSANPACAALARP